MNKFLSFLIIFFGMNGAYAVPFHPIGKAGVEKTYFSKQSCEQKEGQECFDVGSKIVNGELVIEKDPRFHDVMVQMVDDTTKPIFKADYDAENCDSQQDCENKQGTKVCSGGQQDYTKVEKNSLLPGWTLSCTGLQGYQQKQVKVLVENAANKLAAQTSDAQAKTQADAMNAVAKDAAFGEKMIAYVAVRIKAKSLSLADTKQVLSDYDSLISLLRAGSIPHAKTEISSITPDGVRISQADKDALLSEINAYLGQ